MRTFVGVGGGAYTSPIGCTCVLTKTASSPVSIFERTWPADGAMKACGGCGSGAGVQTAVYVDGWLDSLENRFGSTIQFTRNGADQVTSFTDTRGQNWTVAYHATGRIESFTAPDGAAVTLGFSPAGDLMYVDGPATASFPSGTHEEYRYMTGSSTPALNHNMISYTDGAGNDVLTMEYDSSDRVTHQSIGGNDSDFDYSSIGSQQTTVTDAMGNERVWTWDATKLTKTSLVEKTNRGIRSGEGDYTTTWTHDADGYLLTVTHPRGNGTKYTLDAAKQPTEIRRKADMSVGDNNTNDIYDTYTYDSSKYYGMLSHTDPRGKVTNYTLNSYGQATKIEFPQIVIPPSTTYRVEHNFTFNGDGTLDTFTDGEGHVTAYTYYTSGGKKGRVQTVTVDEGSGKLNLETAYDYEAWGDVNSVTDPRGNTTTYTVERYGNVTQIAAPSSLGYLTQFVHDGALRVTQKKVKNIDYDGTWLSTPQWWTTTTTYLATGKASRVSEMITSGSTRLTYFDYDANENLTRITRGTVITEMSYDERDLLYLRIRDPGSSPHVAATETFDYDGNRNMTTHTNARSKVTTHTFDLFDRRTKTTNALGNYTDIAYDKGSHVTERKTYDAAPSPDVLMAHHKSTYDAMGRSTKEEDLHIENSNAWYARTVEYDLDSHVITATDRLSRASAFTYDGAGRRLSQTDPAGNVTEWDYDENGNVTLLTETEVVPGGGTEAYQTEFTYDDINRHETRKVKDRNAPTTSYQLTEWERDALGFVRRTTDPKGNMVTFVRDGLARTTEKHEDLGSSAEIVTSWLYDEHDNVTRLTDDNGSTTDYDFDDLNRLVLKTYDNAKTVAYDHDANGNVIETVDQTGSILDYGYDDLDRRTVCDITKGTGVGGDDDESWGYDPLNRLVSAVDDDSTVEFTYDSLSRVLTEVQGANPLGTEARTVSYAWNAESERTQITYPSGFEARETRDSLGRVSEIKDQSNVSVAAFDLYGAGLRIKKQTNGNGTRGNYVYDGFRRPTDIAHKTSTPTEFAGFEYGWDLNDNPTYEERRHLSGEGDVYTYDKVNRLTKVLRDSTDPSAEAATPSSTTWNEKFEYDMDDVFNLTAYKVTPYGGSTTTTSHAANGMNEYTAIGGVNPTYTDNGALKQDATYKYKYDAHDHLIEVRLSSNNNLVAEYFYDAVGLGRRWKKTVGSATTRFIHADRQSVEERDGSNNLVRLFVFGEQIDHVVMMEAADVADVDNDSNTSEVLRFHHHTQLIGSVTHVTGPSQAVVESYLYDPYGGTTIKDKGGSTLSPTESPIGNSYLYTGRQLDEEIRLFFYRARHYSPDLRRFVQRDPLEYVRIPNAFAYASDRPTLGVDPLGLQDGAAPTVGGGFTGTVQAAGGLTASVEYKISVNPFATGPFVRCWVEVTLGGGAGPGIGGFFGGGLFPPSLDSRAGSRAKNPPGQRTRIWSSRPPHHGMAVGPSRRPEATSTGLCARFGSVTTTRSGPMSIWAGAWRKRRKICAAVARS